MTPRRRFLSRVGTRTGPRLNWAELAGPLEVAPGVRAVMVDERLSRLTPRA